MNPSFFPPLEWERELCPTILCGSRCPIRVTGSQLDGSFPQEDMHCSLTHTWSGWAFRQNWCWNGLTLEAVKMGWMCFLCEKNMNSGVHRDERYGVNCSQIRMLKAEPTTWLYLMTGPLKGKCYEVVRMGPYQSIYGILRRGRHQAGTHAAKGQVRTQPECSHVQAKARSQESNCLHVDLEPPVSRTVRNKFFF